MTPDAHEVRARLEKANRLVAALAAGPFTGDDVRTLVAASAPVLADLERAAGVHPASLATWETVAVLLDERRRLLAWARAHRDGSRRAIEASR